MLRVVFDSRKTIYEEVFTEVAQLLGGGTVGVKVVDTGKEAVVESKEQAAKFLVGVFYPKLEAEVCE